MLRLITNKLAHLYIVVFTISVLYFIPAASGINAPRINAPQINRTDHLLDLPSNLPPSLYASISKQVIFNVTSGKIRFIARVNNSNAKKLKSRLVAYDNLWENLPISLMTLSSSELNSGTFICNCQHLLGPGEYFVSETPIKQVNGSYLSLNDESYKAIMELISYPLDSIALESIAFSELVYVYNATAIKTFLKQRGFELITSRGMLNSPDYPVYRDTQFILIRNIADKQVYVVVRGTSGALDIDTSLDGQLIPFGRKGKVHKGYADIAQYIYKEIKPYFPLGGPDWILTGHSLGGSVAILLSELLSNDGRANTTNSYAPTPLVDLDYYQYQQDLGGSISNFFLPNEEIDIGGKNYNWLYLPGKKITLDYVGKTAGAAHFVINYLKSRLVESDLSRAEYEESLPHCVLTKYPCFEGNNEVFLPACILSSDICLNENIELLLGFHLPPDKMMTLIDTPKLKEWGDILPKNIDAIILDKKYKLIKSKKGSFGRNVILAQLTLLNTLVGNINEARRMHKLIEVKSPDNIVGIFYTKS